MNESCPICKTELFSPKTPSGFEKYFICYKRIQSSYHFVYIKRKNFTYFIRSFQLKDQLHRFIFCDNYENLEKFIEGFRFKIKDNESNIWMEETKFVEKYSKYINLL